MACAEGAPPGMKMGGRAPLLSIDAGQSVAEPAAERRAREGRSNCGGGNPVIQTDPRRQRYHFLSNPTTGRTHGSFLSGQRRRARLSIQEAEMDTIVERCCGLDVHQATIVACLLVGRASQKPRKAVKTFRAMTQDLLALRDWLLSEGCTHVGMESTGVYWKPVHAVLEGAFQIVVGNARHIRNVPGRKTDVKDSEWIADLLRHGLIAKSFVPPKPIRELRDLTRYRRKLVESRTAERNRLLKLLETANVKLASVVTDVFGVSGRLMLQALLEGSRAPAAIAALAKGRLRKKVIDLEYALEGRLEDHHRFLLQLQLQRLDQT